MSWELAEYPFFTKEHHDLASRLVAFANRYGPLMAESVSDVARVSRSLLRALGETGLLEYAVPRASLAWPDVRSICIVREGLAYHSALADNMFVMQGIGTAAIWKHPDDMFRERYLGPCRDGLAIAALALTEKGTGSDISATTTSATQDGDLFVLNGEKTWITNAPIADHFIVVARMGGALGAKGLSGFLVDRNAPGLAVGPQIDNLCDHSMGTVSFHNCQVPLRALITNSGGGFGAMMETFNVFRVSVAAAAVGFARRALDETVGRVRSRTLYGQPMRKLGAIEQRVADMVSDTETAALQCYQAAWLADRREQADQTRSSMAKYVATEAASRVVDAAMQVFGAQGIARGNPIERLYRDVRPTRIYEGASEIQKMIIGRNTLRPPSDA